MNKKNRHLGRAVRLKRQEELERKECLIQEAFKAANKARNREPKTLRKRLTAVELADHLIVSVHSPHAIRDHRSYEPRSYAIGTQVREMIDHVFVRYKPPEHLYRAILSETGMRALYGDFYYRRLRGTRIGIDTRFSDWFFCVAQGKSLATIAAPLMSRAECHWFMNAPASNSIAQNIIWAKTAVLGANPECKAFVARSLGYMLPFVANRLSSFVAFWVNNWDVMSQDDAYEIHQYFAMVCRDQNYTVAGRTLGSVLRAAQNHWAGVEKCTKPALTQIWRERFPYWERRRGKMRVRIVELSRAKDLYVEGEKQRHCIFSYLEQCESGEYAVLSMKSFIESSPHDLAPVEIGRLTIGVKVHRSEIVEVRAKNNRMPTEIESSFIRQYASQRDLTIAPYALED